MSAVSAGEPRVLRVSSELAWTAHVGGEKVGSARVLVRPDERAFVFFDSCRSEAYEPLLAAVAGELRRDVYVTVDEVDDPALRLYEQLGFVVNRRESHYLIPTDPDVTGLRGVEAPSGFLFVRADEVEEARLRALDDALRQDVPGTEGWSWDEAGFREEFEAHSFDPATYLVAVDEATGDYAGIVRVWQNPVLPRLGLVAVLPRHRRRGLAKALLAPVFAVLHERGQAEVSTEVDDTNVASRSLVVGLGARRAGGSVELVRRHRAFAGGDKV